jgi:hypothetical protein
VGKKARLPAIAIAQAGSDRGEVDWLEINISINLK